MNDIAPIEQALANEDPVERIRQLVTTNPTEINGPDALIGHLRGVATAISAIALNYGERHGGRADEAGSSLQATLGENGHKLTASCIRKGGPAMLRLTSDKSYEHVAVPTDKRLSELAARSLMGWCTTDIAATRSTSLSPERGKSPDSPYANIWPFHNLIPQPGQTVNPEANGFSTATARQTLELITEGLEPATRDQLLASFDHRIHETATPSAPRDYFVALQRLSLRLLEVVETRA